MSADDHDAKTKPAEAPDDVSDTMRAIAVAPPAKTLDTIAAASHAVAPDTPNDKAEHDKATDDKVIGIKDKSGT